MRLVFDVGNTRIKWAWVDEGKLAHGGSWMHRGCSDWTLPPELTGAASAAYAVSVASEQTNTRLSDAVAERFGVSLRYFKASPSAGGVRNAYVEAARLGADRWAAIVAAYRRGGPACVMDCGSAVTVDTVDAHGRHLGGMILPGLAMMRRALKQDTAALPEVEHGDIRLFASDTDTAIRSGTLLGLAAMLDGLAMQIRQEVGESMRLYMTGGDSAAIAEAMRVEALLLPDMVLEGVAVLAGELS